VTSIVLKVGASLALGIDAAIGWYLGWRLIKYPENHWGFDNRLLIPFFAAQLLLAFWFRSRLPRGLRGVLMVASGLGVVASTLLITQNILLPYELWIDRGMPMR
jgi:hypothetical protein